MDFKHASRLETLMEDTGLVESAMSLLKKAGLTSDQIMCTPLPGGRNNRAYRLDTAEGPLFLKHYFRGGDWDRLAAESRFLRFCEAVGIDEVPQLVADDAEAGMALHSWFAGERLAPDRLTSDDMDAAAVFLGELARASRRMGTAAIPPARDACLCLEDYFRSPRERVAALEQALLAHPDAPLAAEALDFFRQELYPVWERAQDGVAASLAGKDLRRPLPYAQRIVSPSDFGFHNAVRLRDGRGDSLGFVDFEYAGADDPAKAIGDFICQIDYPPCAGALERLVAAVAGDGEDGSEAAALAARVRALLPLVRVKFCCIVLNEFKATDAERRRFAGGDVERRCAQLRRARRMVASLHEPRDAEYSSTR